MIEKISDLIAQQKVEQVLKRKSTNKAAVQALQTALYELGYGEELNWERFGADGGYGKSTTAAVKSYAANMAVNTSGESVPTPVASKLVEQYEAIEDLRVLKKAVDAKLLSKLRKSKAQNPLAMSLQRVINSVEKDAKLTVDGFFGDGTVTAVKAFGVKEGIQTSGEEVDDSLIEKILEKFLPFLGKGWLEAKREKRDQKKSQKKGQYFLILPEGDRDAKHIKEKREDGESEYYSSPSRMRKRGFPKTSHDQLRVDPKTKAESIWRPYSYQFLPKGHKYTVNGASAEMEFLDVKKFNKDNKQIGGFFHDTKHQKDRIVLHFTVGQTLGDIKTLTREDFDVSTAYILGRDGVIYQLFSPLFWSHHLGAKAKFPNHDQKSIGIELSNYGPLVEDGDGNLLAGDEVKFKYCSLDDTEAYIKLDKPFLGRQYFASYTEQQYEGLIVLLRYLTRDKEETNANFKIEPNFLPTNAALEDQGKWSEIPRYAKFKNLAAAEAFKGICSHINYKDAGKWDMGPYFDWEKVIEGVQAETFSSTLQTKARGKMRAYVTQEQILEEMKALDLGNKYPDAHGPDGPEVDI